MTKETNVALQTAEEQTVAVHPLKKNYSFISSKNVDYDNLTAIEAVSMSLVFVLAITAGTLMSVLS